ncbi:protein jag [Pseudoflavonifractor sp. 60]|uniref:RNA-binding cell elongation regulator Jag/EloR n=1 Tax=Pseudoflavonifractor sp. 60 TaxID=2304576 RepID=UPI0013706521|nr:RNA-binding cell elongation regulator Jag/EloR [Pseudoflavonifractor sp. 60]NBI67058.1 protein jag [Pseudoflavonifractor sp. 60]
MLKWIETTGRSEEDAISAALFQLGLDRDDVSVEVIERAKTGFLGFGSNPAKVRVSYNEVDGKPCSLNDVSLEEPPKPAPAPKPAPVSKQERPAVKEETVLSAPKPAAKKEPPKAAPKKREDPPAPPAEETILAAKPGMPPPKKSQPRREQRRPRPENRVQAGDEVLIGSAPAPVPREPVTVEAVSPDDEKANQIKTFLTGLMEHLNVEAAPEIFITSEGNYKVILQGKDLGAIIGRRGETLDAIQQLTSYTVNRGQSKRVRIHVDAEGYRAKREESLQRLAVKMAGKVVKYRKNMTLEPMNAYERHVIHTALQDYKGVTTYSTGVEPNRRTVVAYAPHQR